jgi:hypothetical protein
MKVLKPSGTGTKGEVRILRREVILPAGPSAPLLARSALDDAIPPPALNGRSDDARVAISEITANAVRHAELVPGNDEIRMTITADDHHVRVDVEQRTPARQVRVIPPDAEPDRIGGFGLHLVDRLADDWGYEPGPPGRVWFEFRV